MFEFYSTKLTNYTVGRISFFILSHGVMSTNKMPADYFTKPVQKIKHYFCGEATGL